MTPRPPAFSALFSARFLAALAASIAIHFSLPLFVSGGVSRHASVASADRVLSVQLIPAPRAPVVETLPEHAIVAPATHSERIAPAAPSADQATSETKAETTRVAGAVPELPDLTYYAARQLDVYPRPIAELDLKYSGKAADEGITGRVRVLALIDELGRVTDVQVVEAEPPNYFEDDAKRALLATRFSPAYRQGRAVRSRFQIELTYGEVTSR